MSDDTPGLSAATAKTNARYRSCEAKDRVYVRIKLRTDPVTRVVASLGHLGTTVDAGAGRGQLGLLLLDAGLVDALAGFDADAAKIGVARRAAGPDADFRVEDLRTADWPDCDTVLLVDVLHYLPPEEQSEALARAAARLRPGGRMVIRESEPQRWGSWVTRATERMALWSGYNRGQGVFLQPLEALEWELESLGFRCSRERASAGPLSDELITATR